MRHFRTAVCVLSCLHRFDHWKKEGDKTEDAIIWDKVLNHRQYDFTRPWLLVRLWYKPPDPDGNSEPVLSKQCDLRKRKANSEERSWLIIDRIQMDSSEYHRSGCSWSSRGKSGLTSLQTREAIPNIQIWLQVKEAFKTRETRKKRCQQHLHWDRMTLSLDSKGNSITVRSSQNVQL